MHEHKLSQMVYDRATRLSKIVRFLSRAFFSTQKNRKIDRFQRVIERLDIKLDIFEAILFEKKSTL